MAELQQPNIVGNFLAAYSSGLERQQQQQDAAYQRQRQAKADQMTEQKYNFDMDAGQLDMALKRASAMNEILAGVDERNPQTLEVAKQRYMTSFGGRPEDVASITMADIPRIKMQSGQLAKELNAQLIRARIGTEQAQGRAADALAGARYAAASGVGAASGYSDKPMPQGQQNKEDDDIEAAQGARSLQMKMQNWINRFEKGGLQTGPLSQITRAQAQFTGLGTTNSRELQLFQSDLESMRNDSLRLNSGVQTEGDAQREWNALIAGVNDQEYVVEALKRIEKLNKRAEQLKLRKIQIRRARNNAAPFDPSLIDEGMGTPSTAAQDDYSDLDAILGLDR